MINSLQRERDESVRFFRKAGGGPVRTMVGGAPGRCKYYFQRYSMKKFLVAVLSALMVAVMAVSAVACSGSASVKIIEIDLTEEEYAFILPRGSELTETINGYIADLKSEEGLGGVTIDELFDAEADGTAENLGEVLTEVPAGADRADYFVVATNAEFAPFEYFQGAYFAGIDMHIAKLFADALGKTLVIRHMKFESVIPTVSGSDYSGDSEDGTAVQPDGIQADIGMAGLTVTPNRAEAVSFTDSYYIAAQRVAVLSDDTAFDECKTKEDVVAVLNTLTGEIAGAATGQTGYTYLAGDNSGTMGEDFKGFADVFAEIKQYNSIGLAVQDLAGARLRVVVGDKFTLAEAVNGING